MDVIKTSTTCCDCEKVLEKPILMPCGQSVCLRHVENVANNIYGCKSCGQEHKTNPEYLFINKGLENLIKANLDKIPFSYECTKAFDYCQQLNDLIMEFELVRKDSSNFVNQIIGKLKNQTELIREEYKLIIDTKANKLIDELNEYERECNSKLETSEFQSVVDKIESDISSIKQDLGEWDKELNDFVSTEEQFETIKEKSREHLFIVNKQTFNFKRQLLNQKLEKFYDSIETFSKIENFVQQCQYPLDIIQDLKPLYDKYVSLEKSTIVDTADLQKELIKLCEFDNSDKWTLLYRASVDGFSVDDFHLKCDDITNTVTIIKSTEGNIFGGFADVSWDTSNLFKHSTRTFIFSLVNKKATPFKVKIHPSNEKYAIYCEASYGPTFGGKIEPDTEDIFISDCSNETNFSYCNFSNAYVHDNYQYGSTEAKSILAGSANFTVSEIEVYKLERFNPI